MVIVYSLIAAVLMLLIIAAFLPKKFTLSVSVSIAASKQEVRNYIKNLKNQEHYSVRVMADPQVELTYTWIDWTVWFIQAWNSDEKNVWKWEQQVIKIDEWTSYEVEIRFEKPMKAVHHAKNVLIDNGDGTTTVTNTFWWENPWPGNLISKLFLPTLRKDMQESMERLKKNIES